jgi:hypothetical protein
MTERSTTIMNLADPAADLPVDHLWADAEGQATHERIVADHQPTRPARSPRRRRVLVGLGVAAAAGAAAAVVGLPGLKHGGTPAAWSVTTNRDGTVSVKITDFRDPAGLQRSLRAAGVRADVSTVPSGCLPGETLGRKVAGVRVVPATFPAPYTWWRLLLRPDGNAVLRSDDLAPGQTDLQEATLGTASQVSIRIAPNELPPGDTIVVGFPENHGGDSMSLQVDRTGAVPYCFPAKQP